MANRISRVTIPHFGGDEQKTIHNPYRNRLAGIWNTNTDVLPAGTHFDRNQYAQYNAGGKPAFTGQDIKPESLWLANQYQRIPGRSTCPKGRRGGSALLFLYTVQRWPRAHAYTRRERSSSHRRLKEGSTGAG